MGEIINKPFKVDVAFSSQGKGFWCDLWQGLVYCDLQTTSDDSDDDMDFGFVKLPHECKDDRKRNDEYPVQARSIRTVGCVGDSVLFVCVDMRSHYTKAVVRIWELQLPLPGGQQLEGKRKRKRTDVRWKEVEKVPAKVLWELPSFKESGLPPAPFQYPILTAQGALCFVLVDQSKRDHTLADHFCIFDMRYKRLLWHGLVHNYEISENVIMQPSSNFLRTKQCSNELEAMEEDSE